jgi:hypothetical protein
MRCQCFMEVDRSAGPPACDTMRIRTCNVRQYLHGDYFSPKALALLSKSLNLDARVLVSLKLAPAAPIPRSLMPKSPAPVPRPPAPCYLSAIFQEDEGCTHDLVNDVLLGTDTKSQQYSPKSPKTCGNEYRSHYRRALLHRWYKAAGLLGCARSVSHRRRRPEGLWRLDISRPGARATHCHRPKAKSVKRIAALAVGVL